MPPDVAVVWTRRQGVGASASQREGAWVRRRAILVAAAMLVVLVVVGGAALAQSLTGNDGDNRLVGSNHRDEISGQGGDDLIKGQRAADALSGGSGDDTIYAGPTNESAMDAVSAGGGDDFVRVFNRPAARDVVDCGDGFDRAVADSRDILAGCNRVRRP